MKNILSFALLLLLLSGCKKLTDVVDREPPNNLVPENVAKTAEGARNLLNGTYAILHEQYNYQQLPEVIPGALAGTIAGNVSAQYQSNAVMPDLAEVNNCWVSLYKMINQSNWVIQLVNELPASEMTIAEKNTITGQAYALRAMAHFDALRFFGQWFDVNSQYGIIIRTAPANFVSRHIKRNTVKEVYTQVLSDLDSAILNAPNFTKPIYMSKTAAKALKARVLLYKGDNLEAANMANEVITTGGRTLSTTFAKVFSDGFASTDMIFMRATDAVTYTADRKKYTYGNRTAIASPWFKTLMTGDPRIAATYTPANSAIIKVNNVTFYAPTYYIRLAEMYLIKAEGMARSGSTVDDAKIPMLAVKSRAYGSAQTTTATTIPELLDEIFKEYIKELAFENGSELGAGVRFNKFGTMKPTITSPNQYILPIPEPELRGNDLFGVQNPGY